MAYSISWYIQDEIIYIRHFGTTTVDDLRGSMSEAKALIESSPRDLVHVINDVSKVTDPLSIKDSMKVVREEGSHPRVGWTFSVGVKSSVIKMGSGLGASIFKLRFRAFDTADEAFAHLKLFDQRISWDKAEATVPVL